ncbi:MAG: 2-haloacid dehalogenase [Solirubrobacteraceae bacterium]|nr:2-haloacid dehalogenase [Solirubrobacteraceae bacterium]
MSPKALLFDVFGTCVDWRTSVAREATALGLPGERVADAWRARYQPQLETVRSGGREWVTLDVLHREALDDVLGELGLELGESGREELTLAWHRLDPWPDTVAGLTRLKRRFVIAPCSNGHIAQSVNLARHAGLPWDAILGAEIAHAYKPDPRVYRASVAALGLEPSDVMMVAAHNGDLHAAAACGLPTGFVARPREHGPGQRSDLHADDGVDVEAADLEALADLL